MQETNDMELYPGWKTVKRIGIGSFGTVFEIERDLFGKTEKAALKHISIPRNDGDIENLYANGYDDEGVTTHFKDTLEDIVREYSLMAEMKGHPNIVYCDDIRYIQHDDGFGWDIFIKMELLTPMTKALGATISDDEIIKLGKDICNALVLCKSKGVVHRDIKPQNIFVSPTGDYKLGDFGIAKTVERTTGGTQAGTLAYMAPEVANFQPYGSSADIYSLGLVLYWLLNERRLPFLPLPPEKLKFSMDEEARKRRLSGEPIPAPIHGSEDLKKIVLKACAYDPKDRYATAAEMLQDLSNGFASAELLRKQEEERRRKEEEERLRKEAEEARRKAEEERKRKEEAERLAREKAEREAKERAERERKEKERLEQERLRKLREEEKEQEKPTYEIRMVIGAICMLLVLIIGAILSNIGTNQPNKQNGSSMSGNVSSSSNGNSNTQHTHAAPAVAVMTHDEFVAAALDAPVMVETYVQAVESWWNGVCHIYAQSEDGGYYIYNLACTEDEAAKLVPGTKIRVSGYKAERFGEVEIIDATYEILEGSWMVSEATDVTALLGTDDLIAHQNELVAMNGLTVAASKDANGNDVPYLYKWDGSGSQGDKLYFKATDGTNTYTFTVNNYMIGTGSDSAVYRAVEALKIGDVIDVEGFLYWYNGAQPHVTSVNVSP